MALKLLAIELVGTLHEQRAVVDVRVVRIGERWHWRAEGKDPRSGKRFKREGKAAQRFDAERELEESALLLLDDLIDARKGCG